MREHELLTLAELAAEVRHLGGDPETTTFVSTGGPVRGHGDDYDVIRQSGPVVVDFSGAEWPGEFVDADEHEDVKLRLVVAETELAQAMKVVAAARAWWTVEATRTGESSTMPGFRGAEAHARRALSIAAQDYETHEQLDAGQQADADRAAEMANDNAAADHEARTQR